MRETGQVLKDVRVADCADGPHEIRGCVRNDLVRTLSDALPLGTVRLGCSVATVDHSTEGLPDKTVSTLRQVAGLALDNEVVQQCSKLLLGAPGPELGVARHTLSLAIHHMMSTHSACART